MAECAVCNLTVEVPSLIVTESKILLAFFRQHLYAPAYLVGLEAFGDIHRHVGGDDDVPILVVAIFYKEYAHDFLTQEAIYVEIATIVARNLLRLSSLIARNHLINVLMESTYIISLIVHLAHSEEMDAAVAYGTHGMDELLVGEPAVAKGVGSTESSLPGALHHGNGAVGLLHVKFLEPRTVGILLVPALGELSLALLVTQAEVLLLALLTVKREVNGNRCATVEVGQYQFLEAQYTLVLHMVVHTADSLYRHARLLKRRVIYDVTAGLLSFLGMFFTKNGEEADAHAQKQTAPVHRLTAHHAIVAVLARLNQIVEIFAVHTEDTLAIETEKTERDDQLQGRNALLLLQSKPAEGLGQPETSESGHNVVVHSLFFV